MTNGEDDMSAAVFQARQFLRAEMTERPEDIERVLVRALREETAADPAIVPRALSRIATLDDAEVLLELVFREEGTALREALGSLPLPRPQWKPASQAVVYLVLRLAPETPWTEEAPCVAMAADLALFRHMLGWAASDEYDWRGRRFKGLPAPRSRWHFAAQAFIWNVKAHGGHDWSECEHCRRVASERSPLMPPDALLRELPRFQVALRDAAEALVDLDVARGRSMVAVSPSTLGEMLRDLEIARKNLDNGETWKTPGREDVLKLLPLLPLERLAETALTAGRLIAAYLDREATRDAASVARMVGRPEAEVRGEAFCEIALLWAHLHALARYEKESSWKHKEEITGVLEALSTSIERSARAWALSTEDILRTAEPGAEHAMDLLALASLHHLEVLAALERVAGDAPEPALRDRARGVLAGVSGRQSPGEGVSRWLADTTARAFDGVPFIPHPLAPLARTWIAAIEVEETFGRGVRRASGLFEGKVRDQGGAEEEALTMALLTELEVAFRDVSLTLASAGRRRLADAISISHRPVAKSEEARWGCDLALLLKARVPGAVTLDTAELVQIKKSQALVGKARQRASPETWRIDTAQLATLLDLSDSSAYWLILSTGEVACVPARFLRGVARGRDLLRQKSYGVGYNEIRHAAIPLEQFLPELFLGAWVGSSDSMTLRFAGGDDAGLKPRHILTIAIEPSQG